ncbi:hypothetical protein CEE37_01285 [candidate division LCP-89 bacterium B3_LCP]|uniref:Protein BatD n=1 Tax=candidate division LCP-89 bacterium B3_LCP TaxID=2012998 RepID=A0A532V563_UNCL8|nr:MAG: hypothetical protein CEE37_01285 [candidate division LCP-89 bacterium B3_LCP]
MIESINSRSVSYRTVDKRLMIFISVAVLLSLLVGITCAADITFTAVVDRTALDVTDTFTLTLQVEGSVSRVSDPKLPELSDFRIISGPNESSTFQIINTNYSLIKSWSYVLKPKRTGTLTIESVRLTHKGKIYSTEPIFLQVGSRTVTTTPGSAKRTTPLPQTTDKESSELFVRVTADKNRIFQNEQVILTYIIYTRVSVNAYEISHLPATPGFWTEEFDSSKQPAVQDEVIGGRHYKKAVIRRVALFSTHPGEMIIDPLEVTCQVQVQRQSRRRQDPFDMMFDSPFSRYRTEERFIQTDPLKLTVLPLPDEGKPRNFSGAVGNFSMEVKIDRDEVSTNEAITMSVRFNGTGNIKLLPQPDFSVPPDFEAYEPKESIKINKSGAKIFGSKTFEYVLIPRIPGKSAIPSINFAYFNPSSGTYQTIKERGFEISVTRSGDGDYGSPSGISREEVKLLAKDVRYLKTPGRLYAVGSAQNLPFAYWVGVALPPLIIVILWWAARLLGAPTLQVRRQQHRIYHKSKDKLKSLVKRTSDTNASATYGAIHNTLLNFLSTKLAIPASGLMEDDVLKELKKRDVPEDIMTTLNDIFNECNAARFAMEVTDQDVLRRLLKRVDIVLDRIEKTWGNKL